ncbi:MAG: sugar phosphate isomerase/epimerase [Clostridiales bacterium]|jgi:sugar phosphate isomerase/epimerase|nr:sugar phosphate isomerase/epimerase [Clostridiales bacterium]
MFYISGFYDEAAGSLKAQIELIKKLGGGYLCPRNLNGKNIADYTAEEFERDILPTLKAEGIKLSSLGSPIGKIGLNDDAAYSAQLKKLKELVKIAAMSGCKYIRCFSFFTDAGADGGRAYSPEVLKKAAERFRGFLDVARGSGIILLHENEKKIFGDIPERVLALYRELNDPNLKLCYDASNYVQCGADPFDAYEKTRDYTAYYHMKDCIDGIEVPLGTGSGKIPEIIKDLTDRNYDGFLTLEPHTAKYALLKIPFYIIPFLTLTRAGRVFRKIDKDRGIKPLQAVGREEVFVWQYENLLKIIEDAKK